MTGARIHSEALKADRELFVYVPDDYRQSRKAYPVLVILDAQDRAQFRAALASVQFLVDRNVVPPMIVAGIPFGASRDHDLSPVATDANARARFPTAGGADQTRRFLVDEALPWLAAHYRTSPLRMLAGHSLGGLFAVGTAALRPEAFRVVIAMSPSLWWSDTLRRELGGRLLQDTEHWRTLFLSSGGREGGIDAATTQFAAELGQGTPTNLAVSHQRYPLFDHSMTPMASLADGLRVAFQPVAVPLDSVVGVLQAKAGKDTSGVRAVIADLETVYAANGSSLLISPILPEAVLNIVGWYCWQIAAPRLALEVLRENVRRYPASGNAYDSMAEAFLVVGDTVATIAASRRTVGLIKRDDDPGRVASIARLRSLH